MSLECSSDFLWKGLRNEPDSWGRFLLHHSYWPRQGAHPSVSFCQRIQCPGFLTLWQWLFKVSPALPTKILSAMPVGSIGAAYLCPVRIFSSSGWTPFSKWCKFIGIHPFLGHLPVFWVWRLYFCKVSIYLCLISSPDFRLFAIRWSSEVTSSSMHLSAMHDLYLFLIPLYFDSISLNTVDNKISSDFTE